VKHWPSTGQVRDVTTSSPALQPSREARFRAVYEATYDDLLRFAQRRVHPSHAEDVAADVFLVAWRRLDDMPDRVGDARPWLFGVARATILNHRRGRRRRDSLAVRLADATVMGGVDASDDLAASRLDLAAGWARLSDAEQEAISLTVWEGLTSAQAGVVLGCSATAYRIRLSRARRSLRRHLDAAILSDSSSRASATAPEGPHR
jgi:RNA polymerase sigma-70 factor (ECF subfamily)